MENSRFQMAGECCVLPAVSLHLVQDLECPAASIDFALHELAAWQLHRLPIIMESLFPEVRALAYLAAEGAFPTAADWWAARVLVFRLHHVPLDVARLGLMDEINTSLRRLATRHGLPMESLLSFFVHAQSGRVVPVTGMLTNQVKCASPVLQSLQLRQSLSAWLAHLQSIWQTR